jgi:putative copper resistance protein D
MSLAYYLSVWLHIVLAAFWIGGMLFLPLVILPGIKQHPDRIQLLYVTGLKFRFYGWVAMVGLFLSGWTNMYLRGMHFSLDFFLNNQYGQLIGWKLLLFTLILIISGVHDFVYGNKALEELKQGENLRFRNLARWSGRINLLLAMTMAFLGLIASRGGNF